MAFPKPIKAPRERRRMRRGAAPMNFIGLMANARLMAAAPDLLAALQETPCPRADFDHDTCDFWAERYGQERCNRCAAINKALGTTKNSEQPASDS